MAKLGISTGTIPNDNTGDSLIVGAIKINSNFDEIYTYLGAGSTDVLSTPIWTTTSIGISTLRNVGVGTTNPTSKLTVDGDVNVSGIVTATNGFISVGNTTPIQISLVGNQLTFTAVGIGSTTLTLL